MLNISGVDQMLLSQKLKSGRFPMKFIYKFANAVVDGKTGELLEFQHLIQQQKYKEEWGTSVGDEIGG